MASSDYILTEEGRAKLEEELHYLETEKRAEIGRILSEATVVTTPKRSNKVNVGSVVTVSIAGAERTFTIVGAAESDVAAGKISNESPVGAALLGRKKGDVVESTGPTGKVTKMEIVKIDH